MGQIFDFSGIEKSEKSIKKTWQEFRDALSKGDFSFDDIASAKKNTFLRVYDDLFNKNAGIEYNTVLISEIEKYCVGRGTILGEDENPDFERFIPKTEFIKEDNRFSPSGVEVANDPVIQIGILPADAISDETKLVEITDSKVLAHINNLVPGLAQAGNAANNATQAVKANGEVLYRAIIPAGANKRK